MRTGNPYIGRYFGNYQVIAEIDCGSFGCVYQAQHTFLPRVAAIKLLHVARLRSQEAHNITHFYKRPNSSRDSSILIFSRFMNLASMTVYPTWL